ncbi:hypothetical protein CVT24_005094 [Panaeolus cyanescens]|uniref:Uncharacterized protein n=1 Tax=Panaeolus cyanescens TaxID=181874 RepID=A0A409W259_9AGAR|nr:hypothetical protein CVT24_005094 [Panaeolus cyanescens]
MMLTELPAIPINVMDDPLANAIPPVPPAAARLPLSPFSLSLSRSSITFTPSIPLLLTLLASLVILASIRAAILFLRPPLSQKGLSIIPALVVKGSLSSTSSSSTSSATSSTTKTSSTKAASGSTSTSEGQSPSDSKTILVPSPTLNLTSSLPAPPPSPGSSEAQMQKQGRRWRSWGWGLVKWETLPLVGGNDVRNGNGTLSGMGNGMRNEMSSGMGNGNEMGRWEQGRQEITQGQGEMRQGQGEMQRQQQQMMMQRRFGSPRMSFLFAWCGVVC